MNMDLIATVVAVLSLTGTAAAQPAEQGTLLRAINFALTTTADKYEFDGSGTCTVHQKEQYFYLDHVDASRITIEKKSEAVFPSPSLSGNPQVIGPQNYEWIEVVLHGEQTIFEDRLPGYRENGRGERFNDPPVRKADVTLKFETKEYDRLVRAWKYIYLHGCKSALSSF